MRFRPQRPKVVLNKVNVPNPFIKAAEAFFPEKPTVSSPFKAFKPNVPNPFNPVRASLGILLGTLSVWCPAVKNVLLFYKMD